MRHLNRATNAASNTVGSVQASEGIAVTALAEENGYRSALYSSRQQTIIATISK